MGSEQPPCGPGLTVQFERLSFPARSFQVSTGLLVAGCVDGRTRLPSGESAVTRLQLMWFVAWPLLFRYRFLILIIHFTLSLANSAALNNARKAPQRSAMVFQGLAVIIYRTQTKMGLVGLHWCWLCVLDVGATGTCVFCSFRLNGSWSGGNYEPCHISNWDPSQNCTSKTLGLSFNLVTWSLQVTQISLKSFSSQFPVSSSAPPPICHQASAPSLPLLGCCPVWTY